MKKTFVLCLPVVLLCGIVTQSGVAQASSTSAGRFAGWSTDKSSAPDIAMTGVIQQVISSHANGAPAGLHLILGSAAGPVDISVGPYLSQELQQELVAGQQIQAIGKTQNINEHNYLLVKQLVLGDRKITIRHDNGSLVRPRSQARIHTQSLQNGELQ